VVDITIKYGYMIAYTVLDGEVTVKSKFCSNALVVTPSTFGGSYQESVTLRTSSRLKEKNTGSGIGIGDT
jgi:hypothetical protein